jgi:hypothetical protein
MIAIMLLLVRTPTVERIQDTSKEDVSLCNEAIAPTSVKLREISKKYQ